MPLLPYVELFSFGQEFALVIPRPSFNQTASALHGGASENDLVGFASVVSNEISRVRDFLDQPSSRTWTLMLLTGGGLAVYLLCRKKCDDDNEALLFPGIEGSTRRRPSSHGRRSRWGARSWFGWLFEPASGLGDDSLAGAVFEGQYFGPLIGPSNDTRRFGLGPKIFDSKLIFAPCPNCLKGTCKVKKHRGTIRQYLTVADSNNSSLTESNTSSSSSTSPLRVQPHSFALVPSTSTPELADDEDSDNESVGIVQRVADLQRYTKKFGKPGADERIEGDGVRLSKLNTSDRSRKSGKSRIPPEGREKIGSNQLSAKNLNLSCGDVNCKDTFCLAQNNNNVANVSNMEKETSIDSVSVGQVSTVSKSMLGLIRGAREVRRLIREASFDSTASEFSLGVSLAEDLCDAERFGLTRLKLSSRCASDLESLVDVREISCSEEEDSQIDFRILHQKCATSQKQKRLWRLSAPINASEFDSPEHNAALNPTQATSNAMPKDASSSSLWSSPQHEWQDHKQSKYKMALFAGGSKNHSSNVSEISEAVDGLEWDTEDFGTNFDDSVSEVGLVNRWLDDNMELDLEAELSRINSERSSRRNSFSSDLDSTYLYRSVRLPPSGRSSVTHGMTGGDSSGETPQKNIDKEMLIRSFGVVITSTSPPKDVSFRPTSISVSKRSCGNNAGIKSPSYSKWKESSPIYDSSCRRHYQRDILSSYDMTTVTMSTTGCLLATTPLSPVHEAKEPRQKHELASPTTDDSVCFNSPTKRPYDTPTKRHNDPSLKDSSPSKRQLFRDISSCALPDLEECNT